MNVYISSSSPYKAFGLAMLLQKKIRGLKIVSLWHDLLKAGANPEVRLKADEDKADRCIDNLTDLEDADVFILMDDYDSVPGGKHFELGVAFKQERTKCIVLGRREHLYTRHEAITNAANLQELIGILKKIKSD